MAVVRCSIIGLASYYLFFLWAHPKVCVMWLPTSASALLNKWAKTIFIFKRWKTGYYIIVTSRSEGNIWAFREMFSLWKTLLCCKSEKMFFEDSDLRDFPNLKPILFLRVPHQPHLPPFSAASPSRRASAPTAREKTPRRCRRSRQRNKFPRIFIRT